jgi:hypothetical protein
LTYSGCPPALTFNTPVAGCHDWIKASTDYLVQQKNVNHVILAFRHAGYLNKNENELTRPPKVFDEQEDSSNIILHALYWQSFEAMVQTLKNHGKDVIILFPVPELSTDIKKLITPFSIFSHELVSENLIIPRERYKRIAGYAEDKLKVIVDKYKVRTIKPFDALCDQNYCNSVIDNKAIFFDDNHLSNFGATVVLSKSLEMSLL